MTFEQSAPCRHRGAPTEDLVEQIAAFLQKIVAEDEEYLSKNGISKDEFARGFPAAVGKIRGSWAASTQDRRDFAELIIQHLAESNAILRYDIPKYGDDTVYRLSLDNGKQVGIIQKGCPDGAHSSTKWVRPPWADELYLWWLCSSLKSHPGDHIWKGVSRVRRKVSKEPDNQLDGIIFYSQTCGTSERPCPKKGLILFADKTSIGMPPPCIYTFPSWEEGKTYLNWRGEVKREFPNILLHAFGIPVDQCINYVGSIGFRLSSGSVRTDITSRYGPAKASTARG